MKKNISKILTIVCFLFLSKGISQNKNATLYFKNGTTLVGLAKITKFNEVKFRKSKGSKKSKFNSKTISRIIIQERTNNIEYVYRTIKDRNHPILIEPIEKGEITIYKENQVNYNGSMSVILYISKGNGNMAFKLGVVPYKDFSIFDKKYRPEYNPRAKRMLKTILNEVKDCSELMKKIESKEFKKKGLLDIAKYYNKNCGA